MDNQTEREIDEMLKDCGEGDEVQYLGSAGLHLDTNQPVTILTGKMTLPSGEEGRVIVLAPNQAAIVFEHGSHGAHFGVVNPEEFLGVGGDSCPECGEAIYAMLHNLVAGAGKFWSEIRANVKTACLLTFTAQEVGVIEDAMNIDNYDFVGLLREVAAKQK